MSLYPNEELLFYLDRRTYYVKLLKQKFQFKHVVDFFTLKCDIAVSKKSTL